MVRITIGIQGGDNPESHKRLEECSDDEIRAIVDAAFEKIGLPLVKGEIEYIDREEPVRLVCPKCKKKAEVYRKSWIYSEQQVVKDPHTKMYNLSWETSNFSLEEPYEREDDIYVCSECGSGIGGTMDDIEELARKK